MAEKQSLPDVVLHILLGTDLGALDSFLRANRDQQRRQDGSILQALNLMNNPFIEARIQLAGKAPAPLITTAPAWPATPTWSIRWSSRFFPGIRRPMR